MAKLHFYYAAMNAGKTTTLLQSSYNYQERGMDTLIFTPAIDNRYGAGVVCSRIGLQESAIPFAAETRIDSIAKARLQENPNIKCILIDEAQFLSKHQVHELCHLADQLNIPVLAYGLRSDFLGEPFEGSLYLLVLADILIEIKTICHCGRKATMNLRINEKGEPIKKGNQVDIGGNERYISVCRQHFHQVDA